MVAQCFLSASIQVFHNLHHNNYLQLYKILAGLMKEPLSHSSRAWLFLACARGARQSHGEHHLQLGGRWETCSPARTCAAREGMAQLTPGRGRGLARDRQGLRKGFLAPESLGHAAASGQGLWQALGTDKGTWIAQSSGTQLAHSWGVLANGVGSPAAAGYCPKCFTHDR